jgi:hypothetical protein
MQGFGQTVPSSVVLYDFLGIGSLNLFSFMGGSANGIDSQLKTFEYILEPFE